MIRINLQSVDNPDMMVLVTLSKCLRGMPIRPLTEPIVLNRYHLIGDLEVNLMLLRVARRTNPKDKAH